MLTLPIAFAPEGHYIPLVGDGDIQPADVLPAKEVPQLLGLQLDEAVVLTAQGLVDGDGPAVSQPAAQQAVYPLTHGSHFRVVAQELELGAGALHLLQAGPDAGVLH